MCKKNKKVYTSVVYGKYIYSMRLGVVRCTNF